MTSNILKKTQKIEFFHINLEKENRTQLHLTNSIHFLIGGKLEHS